MDKETYYGVSEYADTSTDSLGDITFDVTEGSLSPFTLDTNSSFISGGISVNTINLDNIITLDNITYDSSSWDGLAVTIDSSVEFKDVLPTVNKVEDMCNDYPALAKAYENFRTIYKMVEQDWIGRQKKDDSLF
tara:strand:+ start:364 stop:765 length:402 start_codon:yes stop_codon:yes gene_type:complete